MPWTKEMEDKARDMWLDGDTSGMIAVALGNVSRNAVMGKIARMGLSGSEIHKNNQKKSPLIGNKQGEHEAKMERIAAERAAGHHKQSQGAKFGGLLGETKNQSMRSQDGRSYSGPNARPSSAGPTLQFRSKMPPKPVNNTGPSKPLELSQGLMSYLFSLSETDTVPNTSEIVGMVEKLTSQDFKWEEKGHSSALVAIATIFAGGNARYLLIPRFPEPALAQAMRRLAVEGIIVAGKAPETWKDEKDGDRIFFEDMLKSEGLSASVISNTMEESGSKILVAA